MTYALLSVSSLSALLSGAAFLIGGFFLTGVIMGVSAFLLLEMRDWPFFRS